MTVRPAEPGAAELTAMIRRSQILEPGLKRQWLRVLPHLGPRDRERLRAILAGQEPTPSGNDGGRRG